MQKLVRIFLKLFFSPRPEPASPTLHEAKNQEEWLGNGTLYGAKPNTPEVAHGRELDRKSALVQPCSPTYMGISRPSGYKN